MKKQLPDKNGHFGVFGGRYVAETLMPALIELEETYKTSRKDPFFQTEFKYYLKEYSGRKTPLFFAERLTCKLGGAKIYLKREDLNHTGSHKINNTLGQALLAKRLGKLKLIAETGAGQHGVATATIAALLGMECKIFMGNEDIHRQAPNVQRMKILGAQVIPVFSGTATLKDAMNEALRYWVSAVGDTFYVIGTVAGPHPYPMMIRDFQSVIGTETKQQILRKEGRLPDALIACVGGGSNAMGMFYPFRNDFSVKLFGVEASGKGLNTQEHAASINGGKIGFLHGNCTYLLQDEFGQIKDAYSIAAGLDYPGIGPEHSYFSDIGRAKYISITDEEAIEAFKLLSETEGIIPAMESAHAVAYAMKYVPRLKKEELVIINLSGRGDKDVDTILQLANDTKSN